MRAWARRDSPSTAARCTLHCATHVWTCLTACVCVCCVRSMALFAAAANILIGSTAEEWGRGVKCEQRISSHRGQRYFDMSQMPLQSIDDNVPPSYSTKPSPTCRHKGQACGHKCGQIGKVAPFHDTASESLFAQQRLFSAILPPQHSSDA